MGEAFIGSVQLDYSTLGSTNRFAQTLLSKTRPRAGTVITTAFQSAGEGQFGRSWFGSKGTNLCASVILYPQIPATAQFTLSAFVALALRDTVAHFIDKEVSVKWPNDIYVENRKIGGILIQNSISGKSIQNTIIGIGLNVNENNFPEHLPNATSMAIEVGHKATSGSDLAGSPFAIDIVMKKLIESMNDWHQRARNLPLGMLKKQYINHLYKYGEICAFHNSKNDITSSARIMGVDESGRLLLEFPEVGHVEAFTMNQIRHVIA